MSDRARAVHEFVNGELRIEPWSSTRRVAPREAVRAMDDEAAARARAEASSASDGEGPQDAAPPRGTRPTADDDTRAAQSDSGPAARAPEPETLVRLAKVLAHAGIASRRAAEELIERGRVSVNGVVVREQGVRIDPEHDEVMVEGRVVQLDETKRYIMLNKPRGVVSSMSDERGRPDLTEFTREFDERVYNVGRLDQDTSGLLILTNDGELAHILAHPSFGVSKTYLAKVEGRVKPATVQRLLNGIELDDGEVAADRVRVLPGSSGGSSLVELTLHSGRNRIVRRMMAAVGHPVVELVRRQFGPLSLGTLPQGAWRELTRDEREAVLTLASADRRGDAKRARRVGPVRPDNRARGGIRGGDAGGGAGVVGAAGGEGGGASADRGSPGHGGSAQRGSGTPTKREPGTPTKRGRR